MSALGRAALCIALLGAAASAGPARANPQGGTVVGGAATIVQQDPGHLVIQQQSDRAIINWQGFSIGVGELTQFLQPSAAAVALNRVTGGQVSQILGRLTANGQVYLINPNGIVFGAGAVVDVAGLIASTHDIRDQDFLADRLIFDISGAFDSRIVNQGLITAREGGLVALVAPSVENSGVIQARLGRVVLAGTNSATIDPYGDDLIVFEAGSEVVARLSDPDSNPLAALVENSGEIDADGGRVLITVSMARDVVDSAINMTGYIQARSVEMQNGEIVLNGGDTGTTLVSGTLDASGTGAGQTGGTVKVLGEQVALLGDARIDVPGDAGGGRVSIGGAFQGQGPEPNALRSYIGSGAAIAADALSDGDGGEVIVWADEITRYYGSITARGGTEAGDGGSVEVSGKTYLDFRGQVDLTADAGALGTLLLDPDNIVVATGGGAAATDVDQFADNPGTTQTIAPATLDAIAGNVILQALLDITITDAITLNTANASLTAQAGDDINVNARISTTCGDIILIANDMSSGLPSGTGDIFIDTDQLNATFGGGTTAAVTLTVDGGIGSIFLLQDVTILSDTNAMIFNAAVRGDWLLTLDARSGSAVTFSNAVGSGTALGGLNIVQAGTVTFGGAVTTGTPNVGSAGTGAIDIVATAFTQNAGATITANAGLDIRIAGDLAVTENLVANGATTLHADDDSDGAGDFSIAAGKSVTTNGGTLTIRADDVDLQGTIATGAGAVDIAPRTASAMGLGGTATGAFDITDAELDRIATTGLLTLGDVTVSSVTLDGFTYAGTGGFSIIASGAIADIGNVSVAGAATFAAGAGNDIILDNAGNDFASVTIVSGRNVKLADANTLQLDASTVSGTLDVATSGAITDSGNLTVAGAATFAAGAGNDVTLDSTGNDFASIAFTSARNVIVTVANALQLAASTISGFLKATAGAAITDIGNLFVAGTATFTTGTSVNITLDSAGNDFSSVGVTSANNVTLVDVNDLGVADTTIAGALSLSAGGSLDGGDVTVQSLTVAATSVALTGTIAGQSGQAAADSIALTPFGVGPYLFNGFAITAPSSDPALAQAAAQIGLTPETSTATDVTVALATESTEVDPIVMETVESETATETMITEETIAVVEEIVVQESLAEAVDYINGEGDLSLEAQQDFFATLSGTEVVDGLLSSDDPTARSIGRIFEEIAGGAEISQAEMQSRLQDMGVSGGEMLSYLGLFARVRKHARTETLRGAVETLREVSDIADVDVVAPGERHGASAGGGRKIALLIGVDSYLEPIPGLTTPLADVDAVAARLEAKLGYQARVLRNPTKAEIVAALQGLVDELGENDSAIIFYAGHGYILEANGQGYWLPADATTDSARQWISNQNVSEFLSAMRAKNIMLIADSCYAATLLAGEPRKRGVTVRLSRAQLRDKRSVVILSSGGEEPVQDSGGAGHSVFARQLMTVLENLNRDTLGIELYRDIKAGVAELAPQVPQYGGVVSAGHELGADHLLELRL